MDSAYLILIIYAVFATVALFCYWLTPKTKRYIVLLVFSLVAYCVYSKFLTGFVVFSVLIIFFTGKCLNKIDSKLKVSLEGVEDKEEKKKIKKASNKKKKIIIVFSILLNLAILVVLKYTGLFASMFDGIFSWFNVTTHFPILKIGMPIGISYYTLTAIGYLVDVYRGKYPAESNIFKLALFITFFPQAYEGPIAKYDEMMPQYESGGGENFNGKNIANGVLQILWGLFKKMVIADRLAILAGEIFGNYQSYSGGFVVFGILAFTFQLYLEFSGFIDMANGIGNMFGIKLAKNFKQPFFSQTVSEFWRRWHISLGAWCKEYIFYSVSMSKGMRALNKKLHLKVNDFFQVFIPTSIATLAVWLTMGIWHGASWLYVLYGVYYYFVMTIGLCLEPLHKLLYSKLKLNQNNICLVMLRMFRTFILVNIGMLIFRANSISAAAQMFANMFSSGNNGYLFNIIQVKDFVVGIVGVVIVLLVDFLNFKNINILQKFENLNYFVKYLIILALIFIILIFGAYGQGYTVIDALYGGF